MSEEPQGITIPGTKKKIPVKVILLGGAAVVILYFVSKNKGTTAAPSDSQDGMLASEYQQRLQEQWEALQGTIQAKEEPTAGIYQTPPGETPNIREYTTSYDMPSERFQAIPPAVNISNVPPIVAQISPPTSINASTLIVPPRFQLMNDPGDATVPTPKTAAAAAFNTGLPIVATPPSQSFIDQFHAALVPSNNLTMPIAAPPIVTEATAAAAASSTGLPIVATPPSQSFIDQFHAALVPSTPAKIPSSSYTLPGRTTAPAPAPAPAPIHNKPKPR